MANVKKLLAPVAAFVGGGASIQAYLVAAGLAVAATVAAFIWHAAKVETLHAESFKAGQAEVQARWDLAVANAARLQGEQNADATDEFVTEREVVRVEYRDRIKEIKTYVPNPDTHCPADAGFLQRYNAADTSPADDAADQ